MQLVWICLYRGYIYQTPLHVYHYSLEFPCEKFVEEEEKNSDQKISFKGDGDGRDVNGTKVFASILH